MDVNEIDTQWKPPKAQTQVCLDADLALRVEQLEADWMAAAERDKVRTSAADPSEAEPLEDQILALKEEADKKTVTFVFHGLGRRAYTDLLAAHQSDDPDRQWDDGFPPALMAASCEEPAGTDLAWWTRMFDTWTIGQTQKVWGACLAANAGVAEVPFELVDSVRMSVASRKSRRRRTTGSRGRSS